MQLMIVLVSPLSGSGRRETNPRHVSRFSVVQSQRQDLVRHARNLTENPAGLRQEPQGQRIREPVDYSNRRPDGGSNGSGSSADLIPRTR